MGKNKNGKRSRNRNSSRSQTGGGLVKTTPNAGTISFRGSSLLQPTLAAGANVIQLWPQAFSAGILGLGDLFNEYRYSHLEFTPVPEQAGGEITICYYPELTQTVATTAIVAGGVPNSLSVSGVQTTPSTLVITRQTLLGDAPNRWWKTGGTTVTDDWDKYQGTINIVASAASTWEIQVSYSIQFTDMMSNGTLPRPRPSLVKLLPEAGRVGVIDMYLPDSDAPFPDGLSVDQEFLRVTKEMNKTHPRTANKELKRLLLVVSP